MAVTLAQAALNTLNDVDFQVIDNLRRYSWLWDHVPFDDSVSPGSNGATLTYAYTRLITPAGAGFRALNTDYTPGQASRQRFSVDLKPLGGAFTLDRVLANLGPQQTNEIAFQLSQLSISSVVRFQQELVLGDVAADPNGFDGLSKSLTGTVTEKTAGYVAGSADWTAATIAGSLATANLRLDELDDFLSLIVPSHTGSGDMTAPGAIPAGVKALLGNTKMITRLRSIVRASGSYTNTKDDLGRQVEMYGDWALIDIGDRYDGAAPIIPIAAGTNVTDLYAVTFGLDAFHGVTTSGVPMVQTWLPDFAHAGAVKSGELEIGPLAMTLKNTKAAGVLRGIKVS